MFPGSFMIKHFKYPGNRLAEYTAVLGSRSPYNLLPVRFSASGTVMVRCQTRIWFTADQETANSIYGVEWNADGITWLRIAANVHGVKMAHPHPIQCFKLYLKKQFVSSIA